MSIPYRRGVWRHALSIVMLAGCIGGLAPESALAAVLRVGSVANSRFGTDWTLDGSEMQNTRAKLQNPINFGPGGTVPFSIAITDTAATTGSITTALLANFDVFFIGWLDDANPNAFTGAELAALQTWVNGGGVLILTCDDPNHDTGCASFGYPVNNSAQNPMVPAGVGIGHPIFAGPFGAVASFNMSGNQGFFTTTTGATVLAQDSSIAHHPVFLTRFLGAGRVILFADVDIVANAASGGSAISTDNDRVLGNLFAYAAGVLPPVRVGSVANVRFGTTWTLDGGAMTNARAKLLSAANFGPGGTVLRPIAITDTAAAAGSIDAALLANFDVFFIGWLDDANANAFTPTELGALQTWVNGGGILIVTCDDPSHEAVCVSFGYPVATSAQNPMLPVGAGVGHPIFGGPFGAVASFQMDGNQGFFSTTAGATILAQDSSGPPRPVFLIKNQGAGRAILFADVDIIASTLSPGSTITSNNDRVLGNLFAFAGAPGPALLAAVLPVSRSVQVGVVATAFATVIATGPGTGSGCTITPVTPVVLATFGYQTTDPTTNAVTGFPNTPVTIAAGGFQTFIFGFTPTAPFPPTNVQLAFDCGNTSPAPIVSGLNTLLLSASTLPVPDIVALSATTGNDGIVNIPGATGTGAFAVATSNVGVDGTITVSASTGVVSLPITFLVCQTNPVTGECTTTLAPTVTTLIAAGATPTFAIFATGSSTVPFDPANNRVFVLFTEGGAVIRGATSVAVRTQ
ncbi:MAG TPA: hypothetical protein VGT40_13555 [Methylomirabilota bacterium]|nr:hypothetical protein [Methylomirabilota bacterium]